MNVVAHGTDGFLCRLNMSSVLENSRQILSPSSEFMDSHQACSDQLPLFFPLFIFLPFFALFTFPFLILCFVLFTLISEDLSSRQMGSVVLDNVIDDVS